MTRGGGAELRRHFHSFEYGGAMCVIFVVYTSFEGIVIDAYFRLIVGLIVG